MPEKGEKNCWSLRFTGELKNASGRAGALTTGGVEFYSNVITRQAVIETPELIYETIGIDDLYETKELAEKKRNELIEKKFYA